ncbi:MAG: translational GTPase TypA [Clostridia bacterium]|nr:translational GTPase TypA [Clostridia bacterium]
MVRNDIRNIAIIAHVDHGKTTLIDSMLKQAGEFNKSRHVEECVMDSNALERERGITILAKNTAIVYKDVKINVIDTPGHADFSGEVERVLKMVNGVLVLIDATEGPMPQTRFVMQKALEYGHKMIIVVNKIDKKDARTAEIADEFMDLLFDLGGSDKDLDSPILYCSGRSGTATFDPNVPGNSLVPLFETILRYIDPPEGDETGKLQLLVSAIDYNDYVGRIGIGRIERGVVKANSEVAVCDHFASKPPYKAKIANVFQIEGLNRFNVESAEVGDIVCFSGVPSITIGDTVCDVDSIEPLEFVKIGEPTIEMSFSVNNGPFAGREGKFVTSRHLRSRLMKETLKDVSLRVKETDSPDTFLVAGRGEMHFSILIETMRREGYEFMVGMPKVLYRTINGVVCEPYEDLTLDIPDKATGAVMEKLGERNGELVKMTPLGDRMRLEFSIPARCLFGYKNDFLTDTKGEGIMNSLFSGYKKAKNNVVKRNTGSLIAFEAGTAVTYGLFNAQERGILFIEAGTEVYEGMVVGSSPKAEDIRVNVCKKKHVTNMRAAGSDEALRLIPPKKFTLEEAIEFINDDELIEVTPKSIRIRKTILDNNMRTKAHNAASPR